jgi:hypothetical protein
VGKWTGKLCPLSHSLYCYCGRLPSKAALYCLTHPVHSLVIRGVTFRQPDRRKEFCLEYFNF